LFYLASGKVWTKEKVMGGQLHCIEKPTVGTRVFIVVDSVNLPTGFWEGELTEVGPPYTTTNPGPELHFPCHAIITDPLIKTSRDPFGDLGRYYRKEPGHNYLVYTPELAVGYLRRLQSKDRRRISALEERLAIEREVYQAALKAMVSDNSGFNELKKLLSGFLTRLGR
jgi:hypothetical protein